jgi:hypothetical protein
MTSQEFLMFQHYESILRRYHLTQRLLNSGQLGGTLAQSRLTMFGVG